MDDIRRLDVMVYDAFLLTFVQCLFDKRHGVSDNNNNNKLEKKGLVPHTT